MLLYNHVEYYYVFDVVYLIVRCKLLDFHRPTHHDGTHPRLFQWVKDYFVKQTGFKPPLYLQHQGKGTSEILYNYSLENFLINNI